MSLRIPLLTALVGLLLLASGCSYGTPPEFCESGARVTIRQPFGTALFVGDSVAVGAVVSGCPERAGVLWGSSDPRVAVVRAMDGDSAVVKVVGMGTARILARPLAAAAATGELTVFGGRPIAEARALVEFRTATSLELAPTLIVPATPTETQTFVTPPAVCSVFLRLFRDEQRAGAPVWDQEVWFRAQPGGCKLPLQALVVQPSADGRVQGQWVSASQILGDSLAPGRFHFSVRMYRGVAPAIDIPAGTGDLRP